MPERMVRSLYEVFQAIPDPREARGRRHPLSAILTGVVLALVAGQNSLRQIASWLQGLDWTTRQRLGCRRGKVPSLETIRRVLQGVDVVVLAQEIQAWVEEVMALGKPSAPWLGIAVDGKVLRGSGDEAVPALQVLNALVHQMGAMLLSHPIPPGSNELGVVQEVLEGLVLEGRVVTLDALFTQKGVAEAILKKGGTT